MMLISIVAYLLNSKIGTIHTDEKVGFWVQSRDIPYNMFGSGLRDNNRNLRGTALQKVGLSLRNRDSLCGDDADLI